MILFMNKKWIALAVIVLLLALGLVSCLVMNAGTPESPEETATSVQTEDAVKETEEVTFPEGEGIEDTDEEELPEETTKATENTKATESTEATTQPTEESTTKPTETVPQDDPAVTAYEAYLAMSPEEQQAFFESFSSPEAFIAWFNTAKAEYDAKNKTVDGKNGEINIGDYMN